jgi:hypothetical protein
MRQRLSGQQGVDGVKSSMRQPGVAWSIDGFSGIWIWCPSTVTIRLLMAGCAVGKAAEASLSARPAAMKSDKLQAELDLIKVFLGGCGAGTGQAVQECLLPPAGSGAEDNDFSLPLRPGCHHN